jgi:lipopolysaccharide biosynthesis glycosyltransferase
MAGYEGWALWMDCDMLMMEDVNELWALRDDSKAVQVVKHEHRPTEKTKYLGTTQTSYERKNWSSVILFNCAKCKALTPEYVNEAEGLDLHQFKWLEDDQIGDIPHEWNYLVGYDSRASVYNKPVANAHFTIGGPYFREYRGVEYSDAWWDEFRDMTFCAQREE